MIIEERASTHVYRQKRLFDKAELEARESLCVHEQPPYCNAACPLKLDSRSMVAAIAAGDFTKALALYDKITPFPHLLSAGCEAPCEGSCKLCSLGEGISVRELEAAAVRWGEAPRKKGLLRKKTKKAAVFGCDLFTLFLAGELAKKMYPVTVYTSFPDRDSLLAALAPDIPGAAVDLQRLDITFEWNADSAASFAACASTYDILCASLPVAEAVYPGLEVDEAVMVCREHRLITGSTVGILGAAFGAKKAALSADRLAQNLDPANTRGEEGSVETKLYTSLEGVEPSRRIPCTDRDSTVDVILTHEPSAKAGGQLITRHRELNGVHLFLSMLEDTVKFSHWYFGALHLDKAVSRNHTAVFRQVLPVEKPLRHAHKR